MSSNESEGSEEHAVPEGYDWSALDFESASDEEAELFSDWNARNKITEDSDDEEFCQEFLNRERVNLESHQLLWCNQRDDNSEYRVPIDELRKIVDYTKLHNDVEECRQYLKRTSDTTTFVVCSCMMAKRLIPRIHKLKNVRLIYVFCYNKRIHEEWSSRYAKVKQVDPADLSSLLSDLIKEVKEYLKQVKDNIFNEAGRDNNTADISCSTWWQNFVDFIGHLPYPDQCRRRFVTILEKYYQGNEQPLKKLKEFDTTYTPESTLTWYTRETFLYSLLNKTLRQHNIQLTFLLGFYIKDVYVQLKKEHENFKNNYLTEPLLKVYRGQIITGSEFANFIETRQKSGNYTLTINSFFSTSTDRRSALFRLGQPSQHNDDNWQYILFETKIDMRTKSRPFANITHLSDFSGEDEVLFMRGTVFRVYDISYDDTMKIYIVKLVLADHNEELPLDDLTGATTRVTLKNCLSMVREELYKARKLAINAIFMELKELFPTEKGWFEAVSLEYISRGHQLHNWTEELFHYKEAVNIYEMYLNDSEPNCAVDIALIHLDIGYYYQSQGDENNSLADEYYELGIIVCEYALLTVIEKQARVKLYETIVKICKQREKLDYNNISGSVKYQELHAQELLNYYSPHNSYVAKCIVDLADTQKSIFLFEKALENYHKAVQIYLLNSQSKSSDIADIYKEVSEMYIEQKQDFVTAAHFKKMEVEHLLKYDAPDPGDYETEIGMIWRRCRIGESQQELADIYIELHNYSSAYEILIAAKKLYRSISHLYNATNHLTTIEQRMKTVMQKLLQKE